MDVLALLQQATGSGAELPWWVTVLLLPVAAWIGSLISKRNDAAIEEERDERKQRLEEERDERQQRLALEERRVKAQETTALAVDSIGKVLTAMQFQLSAIERHVGMIPEGKVRARGRTESERGE